MTEVKRNEDGDAVTPTENSEDVHDDDDNGTARSESPALGSATEDNETATMSPSEKDAEKLSNSTQTKDAPDEDDEAARMPPPPPPQQTLKGEDPQDDDIVLATAVVGDEVSPRNKLNEDPNHIMYHGRGRGKENERDGTFLFEALEADEPETEEAHMDNIFVRNNPPETELEKALTRVLQRKTSHATRLSQEMRKVKDFISKRKQTYKRKRKLDGAPTRALSAYNIFIKDRFAQLAKENSLALKSDNKEARLMRVPSANLVAETGNMWKDLALEEKQKYEERAKSDRKRYEDEMAAYQPPGGDKLNGNNRKRNKTGYNMFFSAHVLRLKQTESGVPSERGSVARLVGVAWKQLTPEDKQYYEREADKHNGANPVVMGSGGMDDGDEDDDKHLQQPPPVPVPPPMEHYHYQQPPPPQDMHMHAAAAAAIHHDPRAHHAHHQQHQHYYAAAAAAGHLYHPPPPPPHGGGGGGGQGPPQGSHAPQPPPYGHYDYSQHHRHQSRSQQQSYQQQQGGGSSGGGYAHGGY